MQAKFYIYRNLHTGGFSIKKRGLVVDRDNFFIAENVAFKVNEMGRRRVILDKKKNVHAYCVSDKYSYCKFGSMKKIDSLPVITYNPYIAANFNCNGYLINNASKVLFKNGKCYLLER
jgi:hypothetical protein